MRINGDLQALFEEVWEDHFLEEDFVNDIVIRWGRKARTRLGSIMLRDGISIVTINGYLRPKIIPDAIIKAIIGHELTHYVQGFGSNKRQIAKHPHKNRILDNEMIARGMGRMALLENRWTRRNWRNVVEGRLGELAEMTDL